tara:strand:- start:483 stop:1778 length:1296 start_codon:yes stop_codon:yes gene_type:complete
MPEVISCIEHTLLPLVGVRKPGEQSLGAKHAQLLAKLEPNLPAGTIRWAHKGIKCSQFCGVIQLDDLILEILPKIYGKEDDPGACRATLVRMLYKARLFKNHKGGQASINLQRHTLLDVFILHFCIELEAQVVQGKLRHYVGREENLNVLRGRLLIDQQLKHNLAHRERLHCRFDELSEDIPVNQIIKFTLRLLLPLARSPKARKAVIELRMLFDNISDTAICVQSFDCLNRDRTTVRYDSILEQCRVFIDRMNPDVLAGSAKAFSLLFDMNRLFESWLAATLKPLAAKQGLKLREQGPRRYLAHRVDIDKPVFQMKPDMALLDKKQRVVLIADAKWKLLDYSESKLGVSQADLYQIQSYANRYAVKEVLLIYPTQKGLLPVYEMTLQGQHQATLKVVTVDVSGSATGWSASLLSELLPNQHQHPPMLKFV